MDILILSPTPTSPRDYGNRVRIHNVALDLKERGHSVDFLFYPAEDDWRSSFPQSAWREMSETWRNLWIVPPTRSLHSFSIGLDHEIDEWWDPAIGSFLEWIFSTKKYDIFWVNYSWLSKGLDYAPSHCLKVLDTHDIVSGRRQMLASVGIAPEFFHTAEDEEAKALNRADLALAIKPEEAPHFGRISKTEVVVLGHAENFRGPLPELPKRPLLLFGIFAARNNLNVSNILDFLSKAEAVFLNFLCPLEVHIFGSVCDLLPSLDHYSFVRLRGRVVHQSEFYESVDVVIIPMSASSGLKIKAAEALSYGKPLISHQHAFEGLPARHPYHSLPSMEALAHAAIQICFDDDLRKALALKTEMANSASLARFAFGMDEILSRRLKVLPKAIHVILANEELKENDIAALSTLPIYLSNKIDVGVVIIGANRTQRAIFMAQLGSMYIKFVEHLIDFQSLKFAAWLEMANLISSNSTEIIEFLNRPRIVAILDMRLFSGFAPISLSANQVDHMIVVTESPMVGLPGLKISPECPRVTTVTIPRVFWKNAVGSRWVSLPSVDFSGLSALPRMQASFDEACSDAGWVKLWRLLPYFDVEV